MDARVHQSALAAEASPLPSADRVLRSLSASGGERKRLTVMFADIRNSTGLIDRIDPEDAMHRLLAGIEKERAAVITGAGSRE